MFTFKEFLSEDYITEAVGNNDKGIMFELLHAKHMHPEKKLPTHYRDEEGKSPSERHDDIASRMTPEEYKTIDAHAAQSATHMKEHLKSQGHNPDHITHVAWTSNGASDVEKFTGKKDPNNSSDVMFKFQHPKTGKVTHAGVSLKYGSQKYPNLANPGLESLERMSGSKTIIKKYQKHKKNLKSLGFTGTGTENHAKFKKNKNSKNSKAAVESKLDATRGIAKDLHKALSGKSHDELKQYVRNIVSPPTEHDTYRLHTRTAGSNASHHVDSPNTDIDNHLSQFKRLFVPEKHSGGISTTIRGERHDGKIVNVLQHAIKGVSGPMKGLAATTKLPGYTGGK